MCCRALDKIAEKIALCGVPSVAQASCLLEESAAKLQPAMHEPEVPTKGFREALVNFLYAF